MRYAGDGVSNSGVPEHAGYALTDSALSVTVAVDDAPKA
jgi:hypothetical protein